MTIEQSESVPSLMGVNLSRRTLIGAAAVLGSAAVVAGAGLWEVERATTGSLNMPSAEVPVTEQDIIPIPESMVEALQEQEVWIAHGWTGSNLTGFVGIEQASLQKVGVKTYGFKNPDGISPNAQDMFAELDQQLLAARKPIIANFYSLSGILFLEWLATTAENPNSVELLKKLQSVIIVAPELENPLALGRSQSNPVFKRLATIINPSRDDLDSVFPSNQPDYPRYANALSKIAGPVVIFHSPGDDNAPFERTQQLAQTLTALEVDYDPAKQPLVLPDNPQHRAIFVKCPADYAHFQQIPQKAAELFLACMAANVVSTNKMPQTI